MRFSEWKNVKVGDLGRIVTGKTPKTNIEDNYNGSTLFLTPSDDMNSKRVVKTKRTLTEKGVNSVKNCLLPPDSICVSCIGSDLGKVVMTTQNTITNQQINSIIPDENYDSHFIYYAMCMLGKKLNFISKTSTAVPIINKSSFSSYEICVPELIQQKKIAEILTCIDDKIELNNKISENLQSLSQLLLKHWFVDFEFPNEERLPYKSSGGEMVESELGMIPKGWEVNKMGDFLSENRTKVREFDNKNIPEYSTTNVGVYPRDKKFKKNLSKTTDNNKIIMKCDIVFGMSREILNFGVMQEEIGSVSSAYNIFSINKKKFIPELLEMYMRIVPTKFIDLIKPASREGQGLDKKYLMIKNIIVPDISLQEKYFFIYSNILNMIIANKGENVSLIDIRDTLLPKLMSGEIDLSNIEINQ